MDSSETAGRPGDDLGRGRTEKGAQATGEQGVSVEDAMSEVHLSFGMRRPPAKDLKYSDDDRYRGVKNPRTLLFMNRADMGESGWPSST